MRKRVAQEASNVAEKPGPEADADAFRRAAEDGAASLKRRVAEIAKRQSDALAEVRRKANLRDAEAGELAVRSRSEKVSNVSDAAAARPSAASDVGEAVEATKPEEVYGLKGTFSSYRVGPFSSTSQVREGETRASALKRLLGELEEVAKAERVVARDAFLSHFEVAFQK